MSESPQAVWFVEVVNNNTGVVAKKIGPYSSARIADRAEDGVGRNLDWENFHTRVIVGKDKK